MYVTGNSFDIMPTFNDWQGFPNFNEDSLFLAHVAGGSNGSSNQVIYNADGNWVNIDWPNGFATTPVEAVSEIDLKVTFVNV
jgi:hypothetical protein